MTASSTGSPALKKLFADSPTPADYMRGYTAHFAKTVAAMDGAGLAEVAGLVERASTDGRTIFVLANGGSAAVASHFVNDMSVNAIVAGKRGFRCVSLTDNAESLTAVANDAGYENVFLFQLQCMMEKGDLVIALSVSGNSENVMRAVEYANANGAHTIGMSGFDGGRLAKAAKTVLHFPSSRDEYGPVEDAFSVVFHAVSGYLTQKRGRALHH
jgi:D-sedoheptulose 7-phosphate isomerase